MKAVVRINIKYPHLLLFSCTKAPSNFRPVCVAELITFAYSHVTCVPDILPYCTLGCLKMKLQLGKSKT